MVALATGGGDRTAYRGLVSEPTLHVATFAELSPRQLHDLLRLRVDVFVVEQECPYPELDGRDPEPATEHLWLEVGGEVAAYLRILDSGDAPVIGRVVTARGHRGRGYAARLVGVALGRLGGARVRISAQVYLQGWYERLGFVRAGADFVEDGIPHLPMVREPGGTGDGAGARAGGRAG